MSLVKAAGELENTSKHFHNPCPELRVQSTHGQKDNTAPAISCDVLDGNQLHLTSFCVTFSRKKSGVIHVGFAVRNVFSMTKHQPQKMTLQTLEILPPNPADLQEIKATPQKITNITTTRSHLANSQTSP